MLKKISAALIAVSMLAVPAMAETAAKITTTAPVAKSDTATKVQAKTAEAPKAQPTAVQTAREPAKANVLNAKAQMGRHHHRHFHRHRHAHKRMGALHHKAFSSHAAVKTTAAHERG